MNEHPAIRIEMPCDERNAFAQVPQRDRTEGLGRQVQPLQSTQLLVAGFGAQIDDRCDRVCTRELLGKARRKAPADGERRCDPAQIDHHATRCTARTLHRAGNMRRTVGRHAAWAMAVGGMVGGGMFSLAGVLVAAAGPLSCISIVVAAAVALVTQRSYAKLAHDSTAVPITNVSRKWLKHALAWWLVVVYVLALAVYTFTAAHYIGSLFGASKLWIATLGVVIMGCFVTLNLLGAQQPAVLQTLIVWAQFIVLGGLVVIGFVHWNAAHWAGTSSAAGVAKGALLTFVAFEGFEMLAYDQRELTRPRRVMRESLPLALIVVTASYIFVVLAAVSLTGIPALVQASDRPLLVAGYAAAGRGGEIAITLAAAGASISAINATLFSTARLTHSSAKHGVLPSWCASCNRREVPHLSMIAIASTAAAISAVMPLTWLVAAASTGFLLLFAFVNILALTQKSA